MECKQVNAIILLIISIRLATMNAMKAAFIAFSLEHVPHIIGCTYFSPCGAAWKRRKGGKTRGSEGGGDGGRGEGGRGGRKRFRGVERAFKLQLFSNPLVCQGAHFF